MTLVPRLSSSHGVMEITISEMTGSAPTARTRSIRRQRNPLLTLSKPLPNFISTPTLRNRVLDIATMFSLKIISLLLPLLPLSLAAVNGPCSIDGTPGVCVTTTDCAAADGSFRSGFCKNDVENVKCCIKPECGSGGNCRPTDTCDGTTKTGLCPGSTNFKCCEPKSGGDPPPGGGGGGGGGGATTGDLKLSANGVDFIAGFEGFRANYYNDAAVSLVYLSRRS